MAVTWRGHVARIATDRLVIALALGAALSIGLIGAAEAATGASISWAVQVALDVVFVLLARQVAERSTGAPPVRRFWRLTAIGGTLFTVGDLIQLRVSWGDADASAAGGVAQTIMVGAGAGCVAWALLTYPLQVQGREQLRVRLDAATVMCGVAVLTWSATVREAFLPVTSPELASTVLGACLMLASAFAVVRLILSGSAPFTLAAGLTGGLGALLVGIGTALNTAVAEATEIRALLVARLLPSFLIAVAPRIQLLQMRTGAAEQHRRRPAAYSWLPYAAIAGTDLLLVVQLFREGLTVRSGGTLLGVVATTALVIARQHVAFTDNAQLLADVDRSMLELRHQEERFQSLVQHSSDITMLIDRAGRVVYASPALERQLGIDPRHAVGRSALEVLRPEDLQAARDTFRDLARGLTGNMALQLEVQPADGPPRWLELVITNLLDDASVAAIVVNGRDVTESRQLQDRLRHEATHDYLTGLANRALLDARMRDTLRHDDTGGRLAVLIIDLDRFKAVNDRLGHHVGDQLLVIVGDRLRECVRVRDTVARLGGDEFAILLTDTSTAGAQATATRILAALATPVRVGDHELEVRASIGIAVTCTPEQSDAGQPADRSTDQVDELLRAADAAMYQAKSNPSGTRMHVSDHCRPST
ncbi:diguanylate cyclase (GGDEF)-like protein/PAS domain S-box-containing protein [Allocatelliglobosispora scoriae]|uniref:Diguanylate cyclase (GGDEF)-like protein/PAS domain S-box-containing protein n=1 Tax=Allocatelliglobosispora scoriae TaxID=643052 RepID=A0A841C4F7_9ACTN|nr:sensor domain-containing diguanylate cyclase [Allocatelliglobosispora scoriae]MBB5874023.1 diguanylate cyclase (GGDEF)-like protein/PAS domain S-box-containing protein [Allocatelliglobosispora scoriae]